MSTNKHSIGPVAKIALHLLGNLLKFPFDKLKLLYINHAVNKVLINMLKAILRTGILSSTMSICENTYLLIVIVSNKAK